MSKYATATAAQMDQRRVQLRRRIKYLRERGYSSDLPRIARLEEELMELEHHYTRRFLS